MVRRLDGPPAMCSHWHLMWIAKWNVDGSGRKILLGSLRVLDGFVSMLSVSGIRVDHIIVVSGLKEVSEEKYGYMFELAHRLLSHDNTHKWENGRTTFHWISHGSQKCLTELASSISHCIDIKWDFILFSWDHPETMIGVIFISELSHPEIAFNLLLMRALKLMAKKFKRSHSTPFFFSNCLLTKIGDPKWDP